MSHRSLILLAFVGVGGLFIQAIAGIPEPDVILYGSLCVNGVRQRAAQTDVVVEAVVEVGGNPQVVGRYRMGDNQRAGDSYLLRIQRESGVDGSEQSSDAARAGGQIHVTLQKGNAPPTEAASPFTIDEPGTVRRLDLFVGDVGLDGDGDGDLKDFALLQRCFTGSGGGLGTGCSSADLEHDGDVDLDDYKIFRTRIAGPCG